jgi:hypothetical protein
VATFRDAVGITDDLNVHDPKDFEESGPQGKLTGFYQVRVLQAFLESYAELKKSAAADANLYRLGLCLWKDESVYLVTPISFQWEKSQGSPLEYTYQIQFKAFKRIKLDAGVASTKRSYVPIQRSPNKLAQFLNVVQGVRLVLQGSQKVLQAIGGDISYNVFGTLRELSLLAKDALALPLAAADLPDSIVRDLKGAIIEFKGLGRAEKNIVANTRAKFKSVSSHVDELETTLSALTGEASDDPLTDREAHPGLSPFEDPSSDFEFFSGINIGDLNLSPAVLSKIAEESERVRNFTRKDYEDKRNAIKSSIIELSRSLGAGSATYDRVHGYASNTESVSDEPTDDDFEMLFSLNDLLVEMNRLIVSTNDKRPSILDAISSVAGMAEKSGIAFKTPRSKFFAPFPYGSTLEMLAARYLGNPDRWLEIAVLNGLQNPYIDEEGFSLPLHANGSGRNVIVSEISRLFVGQTVWIGSTNALRTRRRVQAIKNLSPGKWLVTVDGDADLAKYLQLAEAYLFAFTPNTVNSQQLIAIPSDIETNEGDLRSKKVPGAKAFDHLQAIGGYDFLLTPKNDLIITPEGGNLWSTGLTNITQKVRIALSSRRGSVLRHPGFGLPLDAGMSVADIRPEEAVQSIESMFVQDPAFGSVEAAQVDINGPVARVGVALQITGTDDVVPIAVELSQ